MKKNKVFQLFALTALLAFGANTLASCNGTLDSSVIETNSEDSMEVVEAKKVLDPLKEASETNQVLIKGAKTLDIGGEVTLSLVFSNQTFDVTWLSHDPNIVSVDSTGKVTALSSGTTQVSVQAIENPYITDDVTITVREVIDDTKEYVKATFANYDGTTLAEVIVENGGTPVYPYSNPTRISDETNSYAFLGWDKTVGAITEDTTFTATYEPTPLSDFLFSVDIENGGYAVDGYSGNATEIVIPSTYNYRKVVSISDAAFRNTAITKVTLPDTIVAIGENAFYNCSYLTELDAPEGTIKSLGESAFYYCSSLKARLVFSEELTEIPANCFYGCAELRSVEAPGLTAVRDCGFANCYVLDFTFNEGLEIIERFAFQWNTLLSNLVLPSTVKSLGESPFCHCRELTSVTINKNLETIVGATATSYSAGVTYQSPFLDSPYLSQIIVEEGSTFFKTDDMNEGLYSYDGKTLYAAVGYNGYDDFDILDGCETINGSVFYNCTWENVNIPSSVKTVGERAFWESNVQNVTFEEPTDETDTTEVTFAGGSSANTFNNSSVGTITLSSLCKDLPAYFANNCHTLRTVVMPAVETIGNYAFTYDYWLENIELPETLTSIGNYAFEYNEEIETVTIPSSVTSIGSYAYCDTRIKAVNFAEDSSLTTISTAAFSYSDLVSIDIPDSVTTLSTYAFRYASSLKSVELSSKLTTLNNAVFQACTALETITFGPGEDRKEDAYSFTINANAFRDGGTNSLKVINFKGTETQFEAVKTKNSAFSSLVETAVAAGLLTINLEYGFTTTETVE